MICNDQWVLFLYQRNVEEKVHSGIENILSRRNILSHVTEKSKDGAGFCMAGSRY